MDCKTFLELLDQDREGCVSASERSEYDRHVESCPPCRSAVKVAEKLRKAYAGQIPEAGKLAGFQQRLFTRIDRLGNESSPPSPASQAKPIIVLIGAGVLLALFGFVFRFFSLTSSPAGVPSQQSSPTPSAPASSTSPSLPVLVSVPTLVPLAHITRENQTIAVAVDSPERIENSRDCRIAFATGESVEIRGESQFKPEPHGMELFRGQATYTFRAVKGTFKVRMPQVVLGIRGTVLRIHITPGEDFVWVDEGAISWEHVSTKKSGLLEKGAGLKFRSGKFEMWVPGQSEPRTSVASTVQRPFPRLETDPVAPIATEPASQVGFVAPSPSNQPPPIKGTDDGF